MEHKHVIDLVADINLMNVNYRIILYIQKIWEEHNWDKVESIEIVFQDREGTRIHGSIPGALKDIFVYKLAEGHTIVLDTFVFASYQSGYRTNTLGFKILFNQDTAVSPSSTFPFNIPEHYLTKFSDIVVGNIDMGILIDVIGRVVLFKPMNEVIKGGRVDESLIVVLQDAMGVELECDLFARYGRIFRSLINLEQGHSTICLFRFVCVKEFKGKYYISTCGDSSALLCDPLSPTIQRFHEMISTRDKSGATDLRS